MSISLLIVSAAFAAVVEAAVQEEAAYLKSVGIGSGRIVGMGEAAPPQELDPAKTKETLATRLAKLGGLSEAGAKIAAEGRKLVA